MSTTYQIQGSLFDSSFKNINHLIPILQSHASNVNTDALQTVFNTLQMDMYNKLIGQLNIFLTNVNNNERDQQRATVKNINDAFNISMSLRKSFESQFPAGTPPPQVYITNVAPLMFDIQSLNENFNNLVLINNMSLW
jgi:hypothetical protein